jgi:hypothetical protein
MEPVNYRKLTPVGRKPNGEENGNKTFFTRLKNWRFRKKRVYFTKRKQIFKLVKIPKVRKPHEQVRFYFNKFNLKPGFVYSKYTSVLNW